jgi:flagellum-specific ATP synthase
LVERAGSTEKGSITALFSALLSQQVDEDPIVDEIKSLTDGHITLSRTLAEQGQYPAVDPLQSLSRFQTKLLSTEELDLASKARLLLSRLQADKDLVAFGGTPDKQLKEALRIERELKEFLAQEKYEISERCETFSMLYSALS